ncbi:MAG: phage N-6-adenine-methyltransferase [Oscillospiraceae bacterium]|nr:phage N-6-adenine-methyltransferase [Oscillospiraceae bacterium]
MSAGRQAFTENKDWCTPVKYVNAVKKVFNGVIELDPCSSVYSIVDARTEFLLPRADGLEKEWNYRTIYVNPPYGNDKMRKTTIRHWFEKIYKTRKEYNSEIIALVPVATNTLHWKKYVYPVASAICFLYDTRLKFIINGSSDNKGAPMSCCVIYYGNDLNSFVDAFFEHGAVIPLNGITCPKYE